MEIHKLVTHENVETALQNDKGSQARLLSFEIKDFTSKGDGYTCYVTSVQVRYFLDLQNSTTSYVLKINLCKDAATNKMVEIQFNKEINFFNVLLPKLNECLQNINQPPLQFPKIFHSSSELGKEFIYLEDMRLKNFKMADAKEGLNATHTELVLKELARLHSASLLLEKFDQVENLKNKYDHLGNIFSDYPPVKKTFAPLYDTCMKTTAAIIGNFDQYKAIAKTMNDSAPRNFEILASVGNEAPRPFQTLCHNDCWINNLLFRYNESGEAVEVCILDHQSETVTSLALELNYFLYTSLLPAVRKPNLKNFLSCYYDSFKSVLQQAGMGMRFTEEELHKEFQRSYMAGLCIFGLVAPMFLADGDSTFDVQDMADGTADNKIKEFTEKVLSNVKENDRIKTIVLDTCDEFLELNLL